MALQATAGSVKGFQVVQQDACSMQCFHVHAVQVVVERLQDLANTVLFLVHRTGPTCFVVREEGSEVKRRVSIGAHLSCSW
jgi:hypothetical protein